MKTCFKIALWYLMGFYIATTAYADDIEVAVSFAVRPYVLSETDTGIELDIVREALAYKGHTILPKYYPYARVLRSFKSTDAVMLVTEEADLQHANYSDAYIIYQNVAVSLQKHDLTINQINDLKNKRIIAFQDAAYYLGDEYRQVIQKNPNYHELPKQENQIALLFMERADVIILDVNIFEYYKQNTKLVDTSEPITIHKIFPENHFKIAFKNSKIRDDFNEGLRKLHETGRYEEILKTYVKEK
jgi:polar amino acid transport system substrate-binding protein